MERTGLQCQSIRWVWPATMHIDCIYGDQRDGCEKREWQSCPPTIFLSAKATPIASRSDWLRIGAGAVFHARHRTRCAGRLAGQPLPAVFCRTRVKVCRLRVGFGHRKAREILRICDNASRRSDGQVLRPSTPRDTELLEFGADDQRVGGAEIGGDQRRVNRYRMRYGPVPWGALRITPRRGRSYNR